MWQAANDIQSLTLSTVLAGFDQALADEIDSKRRDHTIRHIAVDGRLIAQDSGQYVYSFSLKEPWEISDDTPLTIKSTSGTDIKAFVVSSTGTTITVAADQPLPSDALSSIRLVNDSTALLERLREVLKQSDEGASKLASKVLGLSPARSQLQQTPETYGQYRLNNSQQRALAMGGGSEVAFVVGPPGTGKTLMLAVLAFTHMCQGRTVLIASHTNIAVDNAILQLARICRDSHRFSELEQGKIIRFGFPQLKRVQEDSDVYLPLVAGKRSRDLSHQYDLLQSRYTAVETQLTQISTSAAEQKSLWQRERQQLEYDCAALQQQILPLRQAEDQFQQMIKFDITNIDNALLEAYQTKSAATDDIGRLTAEQVRIASGRARRLADVDTLTKRVAEAQAMNGVQRIVRRVNVSRLVQELAQTKHKVWEDDNSLGSIAAHLEQAHYVLHRSTQEAEQLKAHRAGKEAELQRPTPERSRLHELGQRLQSMQQRLSEGEAEQQQKVARFQRDRENLDNEYRQLTDQMGKIATQLRDIEKRVMAEAQVLATTLTKSYIDSDLRGRRYDVVIVDEVSMALAPTVYFAATRADRSVALIGDPNQLAPIVSAKTDAAKQWLARDIFAMRGINLPAAYRGIHGSVLLDEQRRMHPKISVIARRHVYGPDRLRDAHQGDKRYNCIEPCIGKPLVLCDTSDGSPFTTRPENKSRINIYHALCAIRLARQILSSLPQATSEHIEGERVGIVTPYAKQATLLNKMLVDASLAKQVRAGTIHRFQGLEFDAMIFDTVESPPIPHREDFIGGAIGSEGMRLTNVAVTRPRHKLIILANAAHIKQSFSENATLRLAVEDAQAAETIKSREILNLPIPSANPQHSVSIPSLNGERSVQVQATGGVVPELLDDRSFYDRFITDLLTFA